MKRNGAKKGRTTQNGLSVAITAAVNVVLYLLLILAAYLIIRRRPDLISIVLAALGVTASLITLALYRVVYIRRKNYIEKAKEELALARKTTHEEQLQKRKEQLKALQNQINPHFLYNTLDTIRGLAIERDAMDVADIVATLSAMFKYSIDYSNSIVSINDELTHLHSFLKIQSIRFPNKFDYEQIVDCEPSRIYKAQMPKLVLQPLVENVFTHAFVKTSVGGKVRLTMIESNVDFKIIISDNGIGMREDMAMALNRMFEGEENSDDEIFAQSGIALYNINQRIKMYMGERYGLHIDSTPDFGTDITIFLPLEVNNNED